MHDSTKQLLLVPPNTVVIVQGETVDIEGPQVVNLFVQEDKVATKHVAEVCLHSPIVLNIENGQTVFKAITAAGCKGGGGDGLAKVLASQKERSTQTKHAS